MYFVSQVCFSGAYTLVMKEFVIITIHECRVFYYWNSWEHTVFVISYADFSYWNRVFLIARMNNSIFYINMTVAFCNADVLRIARAFVSSAHKLGIITFFSWIITCNICFTFLAPRILQLLYSSLVEKKEKKTRTYE